jgi:heme A synthase
VGLVVVATAWYAYNKVRKTSCPERIKRISKTSAILGIVQGVLGLILFVGVMLNFGGLFQNIILFLHVGNALAIITQASSSATAYDMWEEGEFLTTQNKVSA